LNTNKSYFSLASITLILFIGTIFILTPYYGVILDGDELHSIIFSSGNRENYNLGFEDVMNQYVQAKEWKLQIFQVNEFNPVQIWNDTLKYDVHPPLYNCLLHMVLYFFNGAIFGAYFLNALLLVASLLLISKKTNTNFSSGWILIASLPFILNGFLDIRPYGLLFYFGLQCYFLCKEDEKWSFKLLLFITLGLLTNYLFILFIFALFISKLLANGISVSAFLKNKKYALIIVAACCVAYLFIGNGNQLNVMFDRIDLEGHYFKDKLVNALFSVVGLTFPVWIYKLANILILYMVVFVLGCIVSIGFFSYFVRKRGLFMYEFRCFVIYAILYLVLYFTGVIPHHSVGGKYFLLLTIPLIIPIFKAVENWKISKVVLPVSLMLLLAGEAIFRGNEQTAISSITQKEYTFYSNSNDVFTTLRLVQAMEDEKKIYIGELEGAQILDFDQLFIVDNSEDISKPIELNGKFKKNNLILRKYQKVGTYYYK